MNTIFLKINRKNQINWLTYFSVVMTILTPSFILVLDSSILFLSYIKIIFLCVLSLCSIYCYVKNLTTVKERVFYAFLILFGAFLLLIDKSSFYVIAAMSSVCYKKVKVKNIFKLTFYTMFSFFIFTALMFFIFKLNYDKSLFPTPSSNRPIRFSLGFSHPNTCSSYLNLMIISYICYKQEFKMKEYLLFTFFQIIVFLLTDSRTGLLAYCILLTSMFLTSFIKFDKNVKYLIVFFLILMFIFSFLAGLFLSNSKLNSLLSGRLSYINRVINEKHNLKDLIFGKTYTYPIDNFFANIIFEQGLLSTIFFFFFFIKCIYIISNKFDLKSRTLFSLLILVLLIIGLSETSLRMLPTFIVILPACEFTSKSSCALKQSYIFESYFDFNAKYFLYSIIKY